MNITKREATHRYFQSVKENCLISISALQADHREDEAIFAKIRMNVYDIFQTVFTAGERVAAEDDENLTNFFLTKLEQIPQNWESALVKAEQHGNSEAAHIEQIKLDTVAQIRKNVCEIWEVTL